MENGILWKRIRRIRREEAGIQVTQEPTFSRLVAEEKRNLLRACLQVLFAGFIHVIRERNLIGSRSINQTKYDISGPGHVDADL